MDMSSLLGLFFPETCVGCKRPGTALCASCISRIQLAPETDDAHMSGIFDYQEPVVQKIIWQFKYTNKQEAARILATASVPHIADILSDMLSAASDETFYFVPIPQHIQKTRVRGFNQSERIAKWLSKEFPKSTVAHMLKKSYATLPQAKVRSRSMRAKNVSGSFEAMRKASATDTYIIVDDVTTTGATFHEAMRALKAAGAKQIHCIALAHGYPLRKVI